eukprot:15477754-Alexandrium_andersonii.AAC.1
MGDATSESVLPEVAVLQGGPRLHPARVSRAGRRDAEGSWGSESPGAPMSWPRPCGNAERDAPAVQARQQAPLHQPSGASSPRWTAGGGSGGSPAESPSARTARSSGPRAAPMAEPGS